LAPCRRDAAHSLLILRQGLDFDQRHAARMPSVCARPRADSLSINCGLSRTSLASTVEPEVRVPKGSVISIVDDDSMIREATSGLLRSVGLHAEIFDGPEEFLASGRHLNTSCLIADMQMPGMSGLDLYNHLVASGAPIPTILITAFPINRDREHALRIGVVSYLTKPFNATELLALIHSIVGAGKPL
jgi:CheY-like chemotaxis protein